MVFVRRHASNRCAHFALGGLVLATVIVFSGAFGQALAETTSVIERPEIKAQQESNRPIQDHQDTQTETQSRPPPAEPPSLPSNDHAANQREQGGEEGTEFWPSFLGHRIKITDSLLVIFTAVLAIFTLGLWVSTHRLWKAGERQAGLTREALALNRLEFAASQRPWIKIKLTLSSSLTWHDGRGRVSILVEAINTGNVPALGVDVQIVPRCIMSGDVPSEQIAFADAFYRKSNIGFTVFPNESAPMMHTLEISPTEIARAREWWNGKSVDRNVLFVTLIGCATYWSPIDDDIRQTGIIYKLQKQLAPDGLHDISIGRGDIPLDKLFLKRWVQEGRTN